jgi:hypothetical protein
LLPTRNVTKKEHFVTKKTKKSTAKTKNKSQPAKKTLMKKAAPKKSAAKTSSTRKAKLPLKMRNVDKTKETWADRETNDIVQSHRDNSMAAAPSPGAIPAPDQSHGPDHTELHAHDHEVKQTVKARKKLAHFRPGANSTMPRRQLGR